MAARTQRDVCRGAPKPHFIMMMNAFHQQADGRVFHIPAYRYLRDHHITPTAFSGLLSIVSSINIQLHRLLLIPWEEGRRGSEKVMYVGCRLTVTCHWAAAGRLTWRQKNLSCSSASSGCWLKNDQHNNHSHTEVTSAAPPVGHQQLCNHLSRWSASLWMNEWIIKNMIEWINK